jgi:hypothetical protein
VRPRNPVTIHILLTHGADVSALTALENFAVCFREFTAVKEKAAQNHELHVFERLVIGIPSPHLRTLTTAIEDPQAWLRLDSYSFHYGVMGLLERLRALAGPFVKIGLSWHFILPASTEPSLRTAIAEELKKTIAESWELSNTIETRMSWSPAAYPHHFPRAQMTTPRVL